MEYIEWIGKVVVFCSSWAVGGWVGGLIFNFIRKQIDEREEHQVAAHIFAAHSKPTREGIYMKTELNRTQVNTALLRLCARGLVERKFVGEGDVPYFEITPEGETILAHD